MSPSVTRWLERVYCRRELSRNEAGSIVDTRVATHDSQDQLTTLVFDGGELVVPHLDAIPGERVRARIRARGQRGEGRGRPGDDRPTAWERRPEQTTARRAVAHVEHPGPGTFPPRLQGLDDGPFVPGKALVILMGYHSSLEKVFDGVITARHAEPATTVTDARPVMAGAPVRMRGDRVAQPSDTNRIDLVQRPEFTTLVPPPMCQIGKFGQLGRISVHSRGHRTIIENSSGEPTAAGQTNKKPRRSGVLSKQFLGIICWCGYRRLRSQRGGF